VLEYRDAGYLPDAVLNYLVRLGWSHGDQELFSREEMIRLFDIAAVNASASRFDTGKLDWINQQYLRSGDPEVIAPRLVAQLAAAGLDVRQGPPAAAVIEAYRERATTLRDIATSARYLYAEPADIDAAAVSKHLTAAIAGPLRLFTTRLAGTADWTRAAIHAVMAAVAAECGIGFGKLGQPVRVAVTGGTVSPPIDVTLELLGRERTLERLARAVTRLP
jgi:glutamyl-tRNA synthetase